MSHTPQQTAAARVGPLVWALAILLGRAPAHAQTADFDDGTDAGWAHYEPLAAFGAPVDYSFPQVGPGDRAYRVVAAVSRDPAAVGPARGGSLRPDRAYTTFAASVDVVAWDDSHDEALGLFARVTAPGLGTTNGYAPTKAGGSLDLSRVDGEQPTNLVHAQVEWDPTHRYRLVFAGDGARLTGAAYDRRPPTRPPRWPSSRPTTRPTRPASAAWSCSTTPTIPSSRPTRPTRPSTTMPPACPSRGARRPLGRPWRPSC